MDQLAHARSCWLAVLVLDVDTGQVLASPFGTPGASAPPPGPGMGGGVGPPPPPGARPTAAPPPTVPPKKRVLEGHERGRRVF